MTAAVSWTYGDLLDAVGQSVPERVALIHDDRATTWGELDARSNRVARALLATPEVEAGAHVAFYMTNRAEYLEALAATFKARLVHLNINYRYVEDELFAVLDQGDAAVLVYESCFAEQVGRLAPRLTKVKSYIEVGSDRPLYPGAAAYEDLAAAGSGAPLDIERSEDDLLIIYTGGTTGRPKAVMWRQADRLAVYRRGDRQESPEGFVHRMLQRPGERVFIGAPLMHSTGLTVAAQVLVAGGSVVTVSGNFDPVAVWDQVAAHQAASLSIVGDVFARPLLAALDNGRVHRLGSLRSIVSAGVMWSEEVKQGLHERLPAVALVDTLGSSEGSGLGRSVTRADESPQTARFRIGDGCKVFTPDFREVAPGSGEAGLIAKSGPIPVGYYNDPEATARTFPVIGGVRYSIPGDWCTVEADGTITLLGRGSTCINTGGEKVFPEEVEEALKSIDGIADALVVGVPDRIWGEAVAAVVQHPSELDEGAVRAALHDRLAGYKMPKRLVAVNRVPRGPNAKPDYEAVRALLESGRP